MYKNSSLSYLKFNFWVMFLGVVQNTAVDLPISVFTTYSTALIQLALE
ncbi:MAG: hypothetical protein ACRDBA_12690 [Clostridium sp.]